MRSDKYKFRQVDLNGVRNRNELKIIKGLERLCARHGCASLLDKDWQDIYALALNMLPARYTQIGTIVLGDVVHDVDVDACIEAAYDRVLERPKP